MRTRQAGNPALYGKNVERRRETDEWGYKFRVDGVEYRGPCNTRNKAEAERYAAQIKQEKKDASRKSREAGLGPMRFGHACDVWWEDEGKANKETGLKFRLNWLRKQIGESTLLNEMTADDITNIKNNRAKCVRPAGKDDMGKQLYRPLTPAAVKATLVTLRTVLNYAGKAKGAAMRQFDWRTWIRKDEEEFDVRTMTDTEQELIWPELSDDVREVAEFNLGMPKRINELLPLTKTKVDIKSNTFPHIVIRIKGKRKEIKDPLGPLDVARLRRIMAKGDGPAVFTYVSQRTREYNGLKHVKGQRRQMTYEHFYKEWTAACERAGVSDLNPHCLRHTGATRAYWATGDIYYVSKLLNHANVETTVKYYVKNDPMVVVDFKRRLAENEVSAKISATRRIG